MAIHAGFRLITAADGKGREDGGLRTEDGGWKTRADGPKAEVDGRFTQRGLSPE